MDKKENDHRCRVTNMLIRREFMELLKQLITRILGSGLLSTALVLVRAVTVLMVLYVIWRCYTSFNKGQRRKAPVVMLEDAAPGAHFPVFF